MSTAEFGCVIRHRLSVLRADVRYYGARRRWCALARVLSTHLGPGPLMERCAFCGRKSGGFWANQADWDAAFPAWAGPDSGGTVCRECFDQREGR